MRSCQLFPVSGSGFDFIQHLRRCNIIICILTTGGTVATIYGSSEAILHRFLIYDPCTPYHLIKYHFINFVKSYIL